MKNIPRLIILTWLSLFLAAIAFGQDEKPTPPVTDDPKSQNPQMRMMRDELGLTPEQFQQIRRINAQRKPMTQEAQTKLRQANRALDLAIYADALDEEDVKAKTRDVQNAQAEFLRIKTLTEVLIRKVLTPEQLEKFRTFRERMMNRMNEMKTDQRRPIDRVRDRRNQQPPQ